MHQISTNLRCPSKIYIVKLFFLRDNFLFVFGSLQRGAIHLKYAFVRLLKITTNVTAQSKTVRQRTICGVVLLSGGAWRWRRMHSAPLTRASSRGDGGHACGAGSMGCRFASARKPTPPWNAAMELRRGRLEAHRRTVATLIKHKDVAKKFFTGCLFIDVSVQSPTIAIRSSLYLSALWMSQRGEHGVAISRRSGRGGAWRWIRMRSVPLTRKSSRATGGSCLWSGQWSMARRRPRPPRGALLC
jgi:hypothetical protein